METRRGRVAEKRYKLIGPFLEVTKPVDASNQMTISNKVDTSTLWYKIPTLKELLQSQSTMMNRTLGY